MNNESRLNRSLLTICLWGAAGARAFCAEPVIEPVALYTSFQSEMPAQALHAMREELDWIVSPVGLKFSWRNYADTAHYSPVVRLAVVHFKGKCDTEDLTEFSQYPWKLGWTHTVGGHVIPYIDVFCDAIRAYTAAGLRFVAPKSRDGSFGRAVGRVVAHELYHVFAETRRHAFSGLAKANCTSEELLSDGFRLSTKELQTLRNIFAQTLLLTVRQGMPTAEEQAFSSNGCIGCHGLQGEGTPNGPVIEVQHIPQSVTALRTQLNDPRASMHRRAEKLGLSWSKISTDDLGKLLRFLRTKTGVKVALEAANPD